jgi:hypothetical protein
MLGFVALLLISILSSIVAIWLYRLVSGWQSLIHFSADRNNQTIGKKVITQFAYISPFSASRKGAQNRRPRSLKGDTKTPWGW